MRLRYGGCAVVAGQFLWGLAPLVAYAVCRNVAFLAVFAVVHRDELPTRVARRLPALAEPPVLTPDEDLTLDEDLTTLL